MAGYAHALALAGAEGIGARELAPFAKGIGAILPPIFEQTAEDVAGGGFSGEGNPITSAASSMAHIIETSEAHGIDARMMRAADEMARRVIERGHGTSGFIRIVESMEARG